MLNSSFFWEVNFCNPLHRNSVDLAEKFSFPDWCFSPQLLLKQKTKIIRRFRKLCPSKVIAGHMQMFYVFAITTAIHAATLLKTSFCQSCI